MDSGWRELGVEALRAARMLHQEHPRSAISRAYYAVYARCCAVLERFEVPRARHPATSEPWYPHNQMSANLLALAADWRQFGEVLPLSDMIDEVVVVVDKLRMARVAADYHPEEVLTPEDARDYWRDAAAAADLLDRLAEVQP